MDPKRFSMNLKSLLFAMGCAAFCIFAIGSNPVAEGKERQTRSSRPAGVKPAEMQRPGMVIPRLEKKIHDLINAERKKKGLSALQWNESLNRIARKYSQEMSERNFFSHNDPEGKCFMDRYKEDGFTCRLRVGSTTCLGAENIAQNNLYKSILYLNGIPSYDWNAEDEIAASIVKRWMNSKGHRESILTPYFKRQGIGVAISNDGKVYVTENFC